MSDVTITVRGEHETRIPPERATIRVSVRADGPERGEVVERLMRLTAPLRQSVEERASAGTVTEWTSAQLSVRAERPWNNDGIQLDPVYYANVDITATFTTASELSTWVTDISAWTGVEIGWVNWHLTPETASRWEREVAATAVGVAVARATTYAEALGLHHVEPREIADVGLLAGGQPSTPAAPLMKTRSVAFSADAAPSLDYQPDDIVIAATVEARFLAR